MNAKSVNLSTATDSHYASHSATRFTIRRALVTALCCAVLALVIGQLVGFAAGIEFSIRTIDSIHFALATAIVGGFSTIMFAMDDKDDREADSLPTSRTPRPHGGAYPTTKRAA